MTKRDNALNYEQLLSLLSEGLNTSSDTSSTSDDIRKDRLLEWLSGSFIINTVLINSGRFPSYLTSYLRHLPGELSLANVLLDSGTPIEVLELTRKRFKQEADMQEQKNSSEYAVATTLYYAAVASALLHHGRMTANMTLQDFFDALTVFLQKSWIPPELIRLFRNTLTQCRDIYNTKI